MNRPMLCVSMMLMLFIFCYHEYPLFILDVAIILVVIVIFLRFLVVKFNKEGESYKGNLFLVKIIKIFIKYKVNLYFIIMCLLFAVCLYEMRIAQFNTLKNIGEDCIVVGLVSDVEDNKIELSNFSIISDKDKNLLKIGKFHKLTVNLKSNSRYGDYKILGENIKCFGKLQVLDGKLFYNSQNIDVKLKNAQIIGLREGANKKILIWRYKIRNFVKQKIFENIKHDEASLAQGIFLGEKDMLDKSLRDLFIYSGTAHVLVVSGLHFGILYMLLLAVFSKLNIDFRLSQIIILIIMLIFWFVVGANFSATRALVMIWLHNLSVFCKRRYDLLNSIGVVLFVSILNNPLCVFSIGLQMSIIAVITIGFYNLYSPYLKNILTKKYQNVKNKKIISKINFNTIMIDIFLLPILIQLVFIPHSIYHFKSIYPYGFIFNIPVLAIMPIVVALMVLFVLVVSIVNLSVCSKIVFAVRIERIISFVTESFLGVLYDMVSFVNIIPYNVLRVQEIKGSIVIIIYTILFILALEAQKIKFPTIQNKYVGRRFSD